MWCPALRLTPKTKATPVTMRPISKKPVEEDDKAFLDHFSFFFLLSLTTLLILPHHWSSQRLQKSKGKSYEHL